MCDGIDEEFVPRREPARLPISSVLSKEYAQRCMHIQYLGLNFGCEGCPITQSTPDPEVTYWQTKIQSSEPSGLGSQFGVPEFLRSDLLRQLSGLLGVPECRRSVLVPLSANVVAMSRMPMSFPRMPLLVLTLPRLLVFVVGRQRT